MGNSRDQCTRLLSVLSGWLAARITPGREGRSSLVLGVVLLAVGMAVQVGYWDAMPLWYHLSFLVLLLPATRLGGRLRVGAGPVASAA